ncbi:MAG: transglutaminase domain-containing protein [Chloroflexi bacterium]|nr:transglutaminase domain-containing protein [Chloroflexota bacterium]
MDLWAAGLLLAAIWISALRLEATGWVPDLSIVVLLAVAGVLMGLLLGKSSFAPPVIGLLGVGYTGLFVLWQMDTLIDQQYRWAERLWLLGHRLQETFAIFSGRQPVEDPILFLFSMALLYWCIGLIAGYRQFRYGQAWMPLSMAGVSLLIIDYYNPFIAHRDRYFVAFILCSLLLLGRAYYLRSRDRWVQKGIGFDIEIGTGISRSILIGGLLLVFLAWNFPLLDAGFSPNTTFQDQFTRSWTRVRDRFSNAFASLEGPVVYSTGSYTSQLGLGTGTSTADEIVFTVQTSSTQARGARFYWRGQSFDHYQDGEWSNTLQDAISVAPDDWPLRTLPFSGRSKVQLVFHLYSTSTSTLNVPNLAVAVNRPAEVLAQQLQDDFIDPVAMLVSPPLHAGDVLRADTWVSTPTVALLRGAGEDYPDWVVERYLQLPEGLPERIRRQAEAVTAGQETAYDRVVAVTEYLRNEITYQDSIASPPAGKDPIDWFLFDYRQGFCNYYASAEVLMLRSLGIPARLAVGYAQGNYDSERGMYVVRIRDNHAWPEVYFPDVGWVEFEPTVIQPQRDLLPGSQAEAENELAAASEADQPASDFEDPSRRFDREEGVEIAGEPNPAGGGPAGLAWMGFVALVAAAALGVYIWQRTARHSEPLAVTFTSGLKKRGIQVPPLLQNWAQFSAAPPMDRLFAQVTWMTRFLGRPVPPGLTAAERIQEIVEGVPESETAAVTLLDEYHRAVYSPHGYDLAQARRAVRRMWPAVILHRVTYFILLPVRYLKDRL